MKRGITLLLFPLMVACTGRNANEQAVAQVDSLRHVIVRQDSLVNDIFSSLDQIVANLQQIRMRENLIATRIDAQDRCGRISGDIAAIDSLLRENKIKLLALEHDMERLRSTHLNVTKLECLIGQLTAHMESDDTDIQNLKHELEMKNRQVRNLSGQVEGLELREEKLEAEIAESATQLNKAYYIADSRKNLFAKGIIVRTGLVAKAVKVNDNCSLDPFIRSDIRSLNQIQVDGREPALVSTHPAGSYEFNTDKAGQTWLYILKRNEFWRYTKVLVVAYR